MMTDFGDIKLMNLLIPLTQTSRLKVYVDWLKVSAIQETPTETNIYINGDTRPFMVTEGYNEIIKIVNNKLKEVITKFDKENE